jgi:nucleotide-binding universal stress UspA family protein
MIGVSCETLHVKDRHPGEGIIETAREKACDLIVMASHGRRGLGRLILGSVANEVVTHSTIPVLIYR